MRHSLSSAYVHEFSCTAHCEWAHMARCAVCSHRTCASAAVLCSFSPSGDAYNAEAGKPKLNSGQICFKYTLLAINILFLIFGIVLMAVGSYALNNHVAVLAGQTIPTGLIVLGVFIMLLSILGAGSAWRESRLLLGIYFLFLLLFTIILFAVGIAVYVKKDDSDELLTLAWNDAGRDVRLSLQNVLDCCGLDRWNSEGECPPTQQNNLTARTCLPLMVNTFNDSFTTAGACGIAFSVIMLVRITHGEHARWACGAKGSVTYEMIDKPLLTLARFFPRCLPLSQAGLVFVCYLMSGIKRKSQEQEIARLRTGGENPLGNLEEEAPVYDDEQTQA